MPTVKNKFILASGLTLLLGMSGTLIAQTIDSPICHHPPGQSDHDQDSLKSNGQGHFGQSGVGHASDHPPVNGSCLLGVGPGPTGAVPEPLTMLLFGAGLAGVGYAAKRRKQRAQ